MTANRPNTDQLIPDISKCRSIKRLFFQEELDHRSCPACSQWTNLDELGEWCADCGWSSTMPEVRLDDKRGLVETGF